VDLPSGFYEFGQVKWIQLWKLMNT
jgi:hypothetical protein